MIGVAFNRSGDSTARIWRIDENIRSGANAANEASKNPVVLKHFTNHQEKSKDVTTLDWNVWIFDCSIENLFALVVSVLY